MIAVYLVLGIIVVVTAVAIAKKPVMVMVV